MKKPFYIFGVFVLTVAVITLILGLWTYTFKSVGGTLIKNYKSNKSTVSGYPVPFARDRWRNTPGRVIEYYYRVEDKAFYGDRIGMGFSYWTLSPFKILEWEGSMKGDYILPVYYSSHYPSISVLYRGPDWVMIIILVIIGSSSLRLSLWLNSRYA